MLGLSSNLIKSAYRRGLAYVRDGLKLYMPYRGANHSEVKFVGAGSTTFDGTNDYVSVADDSTLTSSSGFSVACWVKLTTISGDIAIITKNSDLTTFNSSSEFFIINDDGIAEFAVIDQTNNAMIGRKTGTVFTVNTWHHLACTYNGGTVSAGCKIYIDGVQTDTSDETAGSGFASVRDSGQELRFGEFADGGEDFTGNMKNIAFWSRELTATEIQNVMYKTYDELSGRLTSNLVSWWALESDYLDSTTNDNDGTNSGSVQNADIYGGDTPVIPRAIDNAPTVQADGIGIGSASFDTTDDYIQLGNVMNLGSTTDFTVTCWCKATEWTNEGIMGKHEDANNRWHLVTNSSDILVFVGIKGGVTGVNYIGTNALTTYQGSWVHIAIVSDRSANTKGYINGVLDNTRTEADPDLDIDNTGNFTIGFVDDADYYFGGNMCQVGIWNKALTQAQVQSVMEKTYDEFNADDKTSLVSYWGLDVNANDSHGSNNGTLS